ncbi:u3 small nucleolar ribonucleoprotein MPP10, partial [Dinochytrium kinnereticum]
MAKVAIASPLNTLADEVLSKPQIFLIPDEDLSKRLATVAKWMFDTAKKNEPHTMSPLNELHVEGFDLEQVWEQLQLQNLPMLQYLKSEMKKVFPMDVVEKGGKSKSLKRSFEDDDSMVEEEDELSDDDEDLEFDADADLDELDVDEDMDDDLDLNEDEESDADIEVETEDEDEDLGSDLVSDDEEEAGNFHEDDEEKHDGNDDGEPAQPRRGRWTPLDDEFFSLAEMERFAEIGEAKDLSRENKDAIENDEWGLGLGYLGMDPDQL